MSRDNRAASRAFPQELRLIIEIISMANLDNTNKNFAEKSSKPSTIFAKKLHRRFSIGFVLHMPLE